MNQLEAEALIKSQINVTRQQVIVAKSFILKNFNKSTETMLRNLTRSMDIAKPEKVVLHPSVPVEPQISQAVAHITWGLAFGEAVWGLINSTVLIPNGPQLWQISADQQWTTVIPGGGGTTAGWRFEEFEMFVPLAVIIAPSILDNLPQPLSDPDLYLAEYEIPSLHSEVEEALRQAILCFRHELNIPCLAMLAKASEGSWIEMGYSLLRFATKTNGITPKNQEKCCQSAKWDTF
ncbi:hypothetical protein ACFLWC_06465, partial [Chloroflexota bacterium]